MCWELGVVGVGDPGLWEQARLLGAQRDRDREGIRLRSEGQVGPRRPAVGDPQVGQRAGGVALMRGEIELERTLK